MQFICDMIWPFSLCAFDLHLQSTDMISIINGHDLHHHRRSVKVHGAVFMVVHLM